MNRIVYIVGFVVIVIFVLGFFGLRQICTRAPVALSIGYLAMSGRRFPVEDKAHARDAKARASQALNAGRLSAADNTQVDHKADAVPAKEVK